MRKIDNFNKNTKKHYQNHAEKIKKIYQVNAGTFKKNTKQYYKENVDEV